MKMPSIQRCYLLGLLAIIGSFVLAGYLQFVKGLLPCPLCQLQRFCMGALGLLYFFAILHNPRRKGIKRYGYAIFLVSALGALLAGKQVMLQANPVHATQACGVSLRYIFDAFPVLDAFKLTFQGIGDCSRVDWRFLNMSLAEWTFLFFIVLGLWGLGQNWRLKKV